MDIEREGFTQTLNFDFSSSSSTSSSTSTSPSIVTSIWPKKATSAWTKPISVDTSYLERFLLQHHEKNAILPSEKFPFFTNKVLGEQKGYIAQSSNGDLYMIKQTVSSLRLDVISGAKFVLNSYAMNTPWNVKIDGPDYNNCKIYRNHYELFIEYISGPLFEYFLQDRTTSIGLLLPAHRMIESRYCHNKLTTTRIQLSPDPQVIYTRCKFLSNFKSFYDYFGYSGFEVTLKKEDIDKIAVVADITPVILSSFFLGDEDYSRGCTR